MKRNLFLSLAILLSLLLSFSYFSITKMQELSNMTEKMYKHPFVVTNSIRSIQTAILYTDLLIADLNTKKRLGLINLDLAAKIKEQEDKIDLLFQALYTNYLGDLKDIEKIYQEFLKWKKKHKTVLQTLTQEQSANIELSEYSKRHQHKLFFNSVQEILLFADNKAKEFYQRSQELRSEVVSLTIFTAFGVFAFLLGGGVLLARNIAKNQDNLMQQKEDLSTANIRMKLAQDSSGFGIWDYNLVSGELKWDDWMLKIYKIEPSDFTGDVSIWVNSLHPNDKDRTLQALQNAIAGKGEYNLRIRVILHDGSLRHLQANALVIRDEKDVAQRMVGINYDITKFVENEEELRQKDIQLMHQSRLAQMGEMISMIAHQWRQPLTAISAIALDMKLQLELEGDDLCNEKGRTEFVKTSMDSLSDIEIFVKNLTTTIDDFRTFYKPDKIASSTKISSAVAKSFHIVQNSMKAAHIDIILSYEDNEAYLTLFENEMIQVILNLFKNSQDNFEEKNIPSKEIHVHVYASQTHGILDISDNGGGIAPEVLPHIFEPYFTTKDEKNGTGLGLYMVKTIIEEHHHGTISVSNQEDGCCFKIKIPLKKGNDNDDI